MFTHKNLIFKLVLIFFLFSGFSVCGFGIKENGLYANSHNLSDTNRLIECSDYNFSASTSDFPFISNTKIRQLTDYCKLKGDLQSEGNPIVNNFIYGVTNFLFQNESYHTPDYLLMSENNQLIDSFQRDTAVLIDTAFNFDYFDCDVNYYNILVGKYAEMDIVIAYKGGREASYGSGEPIHLGNGTLTATLQEGIINPDGSYLVYKVVGIPENSSLVTVPINLGTINCEVPIYISEPYDSLIDFWVLAYDDLNNDCNKDLDEESANTDGLFIKVFDLEDNMLFVAPAFSGQFEVLNFLGKSDFIYYYIIDNNDLPNDNTPTLPPGLKSGMDQTFLKRYFYFFGGMTYFNTSPKSNLLDTSWDFYYPFDYRICLFRLDAKLESLDCSNPEFLHKINKGENTSNIITINYEGGNGGSFKEQTISSTGISGFTARLYSGFLNEGNGTLSFQVSGISNEAGIAKFNFSIGEQQCEIEFLIQAPELSISKDVKQNSYQWPNEQIDYVISVKNSGNIDLIDILVSDPLTGFSETISLLSVGQTKEFNTSYLVKQDDIDAGYLENMAKASFNFEGIDFNFEAINTINAIQIASMSLVKKSPQISYNTVGDILNYTITVKNTGNISLSNLLVSDPLTGMYETIDMISPGEEKHYKTQYHVKQSDLNSNHIVNIAKVQYLLARLNYFVEDRLEIVADSDGDGVSNIDEIEDKTDPNDPCSFKWASQSLKPSNIWYNLDCDGDGVSNLVELSDRTNPLDSCDFIISNRTLPPSQAWNQGDCDGDGINNAEDGLDDCDGDGIPNFLDSDTCRIDILVPNVFTPNGDGLNDIIKPILLGIESFVCFKIYSPAGNLVFETQNRNEGWDGNIKSSGQSTQSYFWLAEGYGRDGKLVKRTGILTLLR
jgi:gliding motility-associated-like protein